MHEPSFCAPQDTPGEYLPAEYPEYDDDSAHGTNVVSMLVGNGRGYHGEVGTSGIAPDASILFYALRVDHACGEQVPGGGLADLMAAAIVQAVDDGADIISISVGGGNDTDLADARAYAISRGVVIVQSMNNEFTREALPVSRITDPLNGVVLVQAVGPDREPATEGARSAGEGVTVMAPALRSSWWATGTPRCGRPGGSVVVPPSRPRWSPGCSPIPGVSIPRPRVTSCCSR